MSRFAGRIKPFIILVSPLIIGGIFLLYRLTITDVDLLTGFVTLFYFAISAIVAFIYGVYPAFVKAEKLFNNRDTKKNI